MKARLLPHLIISCTLLSGGSITAAEVVHTDPELGRIKVSTIPWDPELKLRTGTFTASGSVLAVYDMNETEAGRELNLAVMNDDGSNMRTFFSGTIPHREKDNGIRFMMFPDNQRIFMGDFVLECAPSIDECHEVDVLPVEYPAEVASGDHIGHRWSEIIVAPDNRHIAWTTLFSNFSAMVFVGELERNGDHYNIANTRIVSTLDPFEPDPNHADGVIPNPIRNGEVKQFIHGGTALSLVGALRRDTADSVVWNLMDGELQQVTDTPGYNETTIFSPDEQLGVVMTSRFSEKTDLAVLGLVPRPYPSALNMALNMPTYMYSVPGVRQSRSGNIGPALVTIEASQTGGDYRGINLNTEDNWVFYSPMSWHPNSNKALWPEGVRGEGRSRMRLQVAHLLDYQPKSKVAPATLSPETWPGSNDLSLVEQFVETSHATEVKVYGRHTGHILYRRSDEGQIEKTYHQFSDDGQQVYHGAEQMVVDPAGNSVYTADLQVSGPTPGEMKLQITFGPMGEALPAQLIFEEDEQGNPRTRGYARYGDQTLTVERLIP